MPAGQALQPAAPGAAAKKPEGQLAQFVSLLFEQASTMKLPALQTLQVAQAARPPDE